MVQIEINQIYRNFAWCEEYSEKSFIGILHEENLWSDEEYFKLENELYKQCEKYSQSDVLPRNIAWPTMRVF